MARSPPAGEDDLDALFEIDPSMDEIFNTKATTASNNTREPVRDNNNESTRRSEAQGIDEEIKITKKRQPVAKLDDARLLADPGIPKLQRISKTRLKFRGKGHEFSDVAQLLRTYQLWLDDLYPRAKFADGLAMVEKLGHSKRMQLMRKTWIDESKPKASFEEDDTQHEPLPATFNPGSEPTITGIMLRGSISAEASPRPDGDINELEIISQRRTTGAEPSVGSPAMSNRGAPDEDELDALLGEDPDLNRPQNGNSNEITPSQGSHRPKSTTEPSFEDDEEALREMEIW